MGRQVRPHKPDELTPEDLAGPEGWYGVPALTGGYASRPRLTALLDARPDTPLVVISAPAGTGKTSVTAEWVSGFADSSRTAWVTFDLRDPMFWPAFVACLRRLGAPVPEAGPPDHASTVDRQFLLALATGLAGLPERVTVVVDGYELVDRAVAKDVDFLLRHSGHRLRLVILTRADPLLPLYRYRLEEQITELRIADLAFTDEEAARLLTTSGARLTPSSVRTLNARTGGWAVGLRFAARVIATREQPDEAVEEVTGDEGNIAEYLLGEVLSAQPPEIRQLLLSTSVPDTLGPGSPRRWVAGPQVGRWPS